MKRFNNILFVADDSREQTAALKKTIELARDVDASITVIGIVESAEIIPFPEGEIDIVKLQEELILAKQNELEKLTKSAIGRKKITIPVLVNEGRDYIEIIRAVKKNKFDLVVKASGKPHLTGMLFSTLDMNLVKKCPCPVLIMKPRKKITHSRILAAVDLRRKDKTQKNMDRTIMELSRDLAALEKGTLHILHAWHMSFESHFRAHPEVEMAYKSVNSMVKEIRTIEKQHLNDLAEEFSLTPSDTHLIKGNPIQVIPRFVRSQRIDLVVMGTVGRTGISGFFMGNTAEKILSNINCSVLAIKPKGWKTPVE